MRIYNTLTRHIRPVSQRKQRMPSSRWNIGTPLVESRVTGCMKELEDLKLLSVSLHPQFFLFLQDLVSVSFMLL